MGVHPYSNAAASPGPGGYNPNGSAGLGGPGGAHSRGMTGDDTLGYPSQGRTSAMGYTRGYGSNVAVRGINPSGPNASGSVGVHNGMMGPGGMGPVPEEREKKGFFATLCCR
ncbi:hypothetical protein CPB86DRAFT_787825 [Serendipita vermifera]|nr:hypothetical protein CPB86DRAFT_787825 [Serendipita vermifera]